MPAPDWPVVSLGEVLDSVKRPVRLMPEGSYRTLGVRWYGKGPFAKPPQKGADIAAKTLNEFHVGDVVYSKLFAWKGSFGMVSEETDGVLGSTEFPSYVASVDELFPEFFALWASRPEVWDEADLVSTGTTANSRNRLAPDDFLDFEMPLPSMAEQRRIISTVAEVDASQLAVRDALAAARRLRESVWTETWERLLEVARIVVEL